MTVKTYKKWDILLGWMVFLIALLVYGITVEPTSSFWDSGEYISTSAKLQVGHPPGAPLFQMLGAFFAMFALESSQVAMMVNFMSVFSSAFAVIFTFWTITNIVRKFIGKDEELTHSKGIAILGSGLLGALTLTFSDSFWFNAVETEVYAMSSLLMALQLWLGLKWIDEIDTPRGNKWLVFICFIIGLTFGVQFMGFLAIPSIGLLYYFKRYRTVTVKNFVLANIIVIGILMFIYKFSLTYVLKLFGWGEVFFVNSIGLPFHSGTIIIGLLFIGFFVGALNYTRKRNMLKVHTLVLCALFLSLGFSCWLMLPIRANAKVVINENNPQDARSLLSYYNREQYPSVQSPIYGTYYSDSFAGLNEENPYKDDQPFYEKDEKTKKYVIVNEYKDGIQNPHPDHIGFLPRMWSGDHVENYMKYQGILEFKITPEYLGNKKIRAAATKYRKAIANGEIQVEQYIKFLRNFVQNDFIEVLPPTLMQNLTFMLDYQLGEMYWRYFMWNFVGKQDDVQWHNDKHGNWLSGITAIDNLRKNRLGNQKNLPEDIKNNKGRNTYYFIPLILGIIGVLFQIKRDPKRFWVLLIFFLFTGIAIQIYTNPYAFQPRERDYSLVGSFYVFAIWVGMGLYAILDYLKKINPPKIITPLVTLICLLSVPGLMAYQNWDDHDRSNRYTTRSMAKSYLDSVKEDVGALLFTIGDNDTFALWYAQEIENYRTDVRTINTSLLATDWYIDQMKRKVYKSPPIPSQLTHKKYVWGTRDAIIHRKLIDKRWSLEQFMSWISRDDKANKIGNLMKRSGQDTSEIPAYYLNRIFYPTDKIRIPVNKKNVLKSGLVKPKDSALIVDYIDIKIPSIMGKNRIMMLDIINSNDWKRPIYFTGGSLDSAEYIWMKDYLQLDGLAYKLVPIKTDHKKLSGFEMGRIDTELMYNIVTQWEWGNSGSNRIYHDPETRKNSINFRSNLARLTEKLLNQNKLEKAKNIIEIAMKNMPVEYFGYYAFVEPFLDGYYKVSEQKKGKTLYQKLVAIYQNRLNYYASIPIEEQYFEVENIYEDLRAYQRNIDILISNKEDKVFITQEIQKYNDYIDEFQTQFDTLFEKKSLEPESPDNVTDSTASPNEEDTITK